LQHLLVFFHLLLVLAFELNLVLAFTARTAQDLFQLGLPSSHSFDRPLPKVSPYLSFDLLFKSLKGGVEFPVLEILANIFKDFFLGGLGHYLNCDIDNKPFELSIFHII